MHVLTQSTEASVLLTCLRVTNNQMDGLTLSTPEKTPHEDAIINNTRIFPYTIQYLPTSEQKVELASSQRWKSSVLSTLGKYFSLAECCSTSCLFVHLI